MLDVRGAVSGRGWLTRRLTAFAGLFWEEGGLLEDLRRAQREKILRFHSLDVRGAVSGRGWLTRRLTAFAGLFWEEGG